MSQKRGIGGSDLAAVCAYYKREHHDTWAHFQTAADVWMRLVHNIEQPKTAAMMRGLDAEPRLRKAFLDAYGGELEFHERPWIVRHPRLPFVSVSPDDVWLNNGERVYAEWKTRNKFAEQKRPMFGRPGTDEVAVPYGLQVQLNLEILDLERAVLFAGFGCETKDEKGEKPFLYSNTEPFYIDRDREQLAYALSYAERFHEEHILTRMPPSVEPRANLVPWRRLMKEKPWTTATEMEVPSQSSNMSEPSPSP